MPRILVSSRRGLRPAALALAASLVQGAAAGQEAAPPYRDPGLPVEQRVRDLLGRMTLEEKAAQLTMSGASMDVVDLTGKYTTESARLALSEMSTPLSKVSVREGAVLRNVVQRYLMTKTRLGIPALFQGEPRRARWRSRWWRGSRVRSRQETGVIGGDWVYTSGWQEGGGQ